MSKKKNINSVVKNINNSLYSLSIRNNADFDYHKVYMGKEHFLIPRTKFKHNGYLSPTNILIAEETIRTSLQNNFFKKLSFRSFRKTKDL